MYIERVRKNVELKFISTSIYTRVVRGGGYRRVRTQRIFFKFSSVFGFGSYRMKKKKKKKKYLVYTFGK